MIKLGPFAGVLPLFYIFKPCVHKDAFDLKGLKTSKISQIYANTGIC